MGPGAPAHLFAGLSLTACVDEMVVESAGKAPSPALREDVGGTEELPSREAADAGRSDAGPPAADAGPEDVRVEDTADASVCRLEECAARAAYPCEWARCDSATGTCLVLTSEDGTPCSDGLDDTRGDRCVAGVCRGVLGLPRAVGWATSDRPVRLGAVRPAPDGELAVDDLGSLPRWSVSSGAPSGVPPTRVGDRLVGFHDHANVDDAPRAFELDPLTGALHVLPITLGLGSWSAPAAVEGRAAVVSCRLGAECVRVDLEPPAVHPLGVCAGPYGQCLSRPRPADGRWLIMPRWDRQAGTGQVVARRVDGEVPGPEQTVWSGPERFAVLVALPGDRILLGVAPGGGPPHDTLRSFERGWVVDLTGRWPAFEWSVSRPWRSFAASESWLALCSRETALLYHLEGPWPPMPVEIPGVNSCGFSPSGRWLVVTEPAEGQVVVRDMSGGEPGPPRPLSPPRSTLTSKTWLVTIAERAGVVVYRLGVRELRATRLEPADVPGEPWLLLDDSRFRLAGPQPLLTEDGRSLWVPRERGGALVDLAPPEAGPRPRTFLPDHRIRWWHVRRTDGALLVAWDGETRQRLVRSEPGGLEELARISMGRPSGPRCYRGGVHLEGELRVSAFGVGLGVGMLASLAGEAPSPFAVDGRVKAWVSIPLLITSKDISVSFSVGWKEPSLSSPPPRWPVARLGAVQERTGRSWSFPPTDVQSEPRVQWEEGYGPPAVGGQGDGDAPALPPVVPIDARPTIEFAIPLARQPAVGLVPELTAGFAPAGAQVTRVVLQSVDGVPEVVFSWEAGEPGPGGRAPAVWVLSPPPSPDEEAQGGNDDDDAMSGPSLRLVSACPMPAGLTDPDSPLLHELVATDAPFPQRGSAPAQALEEGLRRDEGPGVVTHLEPETRYRLRVEVEQGEDPEIRTTTVAEFSTGQAPGRPCPAPPEDPPGLRALYPFGGPLTTFSTWVASTFPAPHSRFVYRRTSLWFRFDSPWCPAEVYRSLEAAVVVAGATSPDWLVVKLEPEPDLRVRPLPPEHEFWTTLLEHSDLLDPALARWGSRLRGKPQIALPGETIEEPSAPEGRSACQIVLRCPGEADASDQLHAYPAELRAILASLKLPTDPLPIRQARPPPDDDALDWAA